jgi:predicted branched-subunit amino acid permease
VVGRVATAAVGAAEQLGPPQGDRAAFRSGCWAGTTSVFALVMSGNYLSIGALAHDYGFSCLWVVLSTILMWAGPAQVIVISALGAGMTTIEATLAVYLSGIRLMPMVVSLMPMLRTPQTRMRDLYLPAHFTAISPWIEALRLLPRVPRPDRIAYFNGIGTAFVTNATLFTVVGYYLAATFPKSVVAALLFLSPASFLISMTNNSRTGADFVALALGFALVPLFDIFHVPLDLLWTGLVGGTAAYLFHRASTRKRNAAR